VLLLLVSAGGADAADKLLVGLRDVIDTVEQTYRQVNNVTADFFQRSTMNNNQRELRAAGEMILSPPTGTDPLKFRFDYFRPTKQEIVSDGRTMWFYMPESRKVIRSDIRFMFNPMSFNPDHPEQGRPVNFLQGLGRISKDFTIGFAEQHQDVAGNYVLELEPLRPTAFIRKLFIVVRSESVLNRKNPEIFRKRDDEFRRSLLFPIISTTVIDHQGNSTVMEFTNIRVNGFVSSMLFDFVVPANVQVVRPPAPPE
jgi:outer membrane lipoprotein-sorting protein